jgi:hypothetical protein
VRAGRWRHTLAAEGLTYIADSSAYLDNRR